MCSPRARTVTLLGCSLTLTSWVAPHRTADTKPLVPTGRHP